MFETQAGPRARYQALCTRIEIMVGGKLRCIGGPQHLKNRFGNHLELEVKPTEVSSLDLDAMCQTIQDKFFHMASPPQSILNDLEGCIGRADSSTAETVAEISLSNEMIVTIARWLGNEVRVQTLVSAYRDSRGAFGERLSEQLLRDGMNKFVFQVPHMLDDSYLCSSEANMERNRNALGISEYSISQSTLETIFNHLATNS